MGRRGKLEALQDDIEEGRTDWFIKRIASGVAVELRREFDAAYDRGFYDAMNQEQFTLTGQHMGEVVSKFPGIYDNDKWVADPTAPPSMVMMLNADYLTPEDREQGVGWLSDIVNQVDLAPHPYAHLQQAPPVDESTPSLDPSQLPQDYMRLELPVGWRLLAVNSMPADSTRRTVVLTLSPRLPVSSRYLLGTAQRGKQYVVYGQGESFVVREDSPTPDVQESPHDMQSPVASTRLLQLLEQVVSVLESAVPYPGGVPSETKRRASKNLAEIRGLVERAAELTRDLHSDLDGWGVNW